MKQFIKIITLILPIILMQPNLANATTAPNNMRLMLSELRGGDYAHAGDVESIDMVLHKLRTLVPYLESGKVLDVGCGFGGTLEYLKSEGFHDLYGIDINKESIKYAKQKYQGIDFRIGDALDCDVLFAWQSFDLVLMFNSIYAIYDKDKLLSALGNVMKPGAILVVFDYSSPRGSSLEVLDFAGKEMKPVHLGSFTKSLQSKGFGLLEADDISDKYIKWYKEFLQKLEKNKSSLLSRFSEDEITKVHGTFAYFLKQLESKNMGGIVLYAKKL